MDDLILKELGGRATDLETHRLGQWRRAAEANERTYRELRAVWDMMGEAPRPPVADPPRVSAITEAAVRRRQVGRRAARGLHARLRRHLGKGVALAAVAAFLLVGVLRRDRAPAEPLTPTGSSTMAGDVTTMTLSDGSVVRLAPATQVRFTGAADRREVVLGGRAFFAVAPGARPFVVRTNAGRVMVHGTRFEVQADGDALRLIVVEGRVLLDGDGGSVEVSPGQVAYLARGGAPRVVERVDVWTLLDWPDGVLLFQGTPLGEVGREIGRRFDRRVVVDPAVASRRVTAWFEDEALDEVVSSVCLVADVQCVVGDARVTMEGR